MRFVRPILFFLVTGIALFCGAHFYNTRKAFAYPISMKCNANGQLEDLKLSQDHLEAIQDFLARFHAPIPQDKHAAAINYFCHGLKDCEKRFEQAARLVGISAEISQTLLRQELAKAKQGLDEIDLRLDAATNRLLNESRRLNSCHNTFSKLNSKDFLVNGIALFYYPRSNQYQYVSGCRRTRAGDQEAPLECTLNELENLKSGIKSAVESGIDPYAFLSLALMENGSNDWIPTLDPIGEFSATGCKVLSTDTKPATSSRATSVFEDFDRHHHVQGGQVLENSKLNEWFRLNPRVQSWVKKHLSADQMNGRSYFCANSREFVSVKEMNRLKENGLISADNCCTQLPFDFSSVSLEKASDLNDFVNDGLRSVYLKRFELGFSSLSTTNRDSALEAAYRLQRFNGFNRKSGSAETMPAWRSGVNTYQEPVYGYQALDYVLNSLMTNPLVNELIEEEYKIQKKPRAKSFLCAGRKLPSQFIIDSDAYYKLHRDSKRLVWLKGKKAVDYSDGEAQLMRSELEDSGLPLDLTDQNLEMYWKSVYPKRNTIGKASYLDWKPISDLEIKEIRKRILEQ